MWNEGWQGLQPINPTVYCTIPESEPIIELGAHWEVIGKCQTPLYVLWTLDGELLCFHSWGLEELHEFLEGSIYYNDDGSSLKGTYQVQIVCGIEVIEESSPCSVP